MNLQLLPDFLAIGSLVAVFVSLLRRTHQTRMRSWVVGWALILVHIVAESVSDNAPALADAANALSALTLLLASVAFVWAALQPVRGRRRLLWRLLAAQLPDMVFLVLLFANFERAGVYVALCTAGALGSVLALRGGSRRADRRERVGFAVAIVLVYALQAALAGTAHYNYAFDWMLSWHYLAVAVLFWRGAGHVRTGRVFTTASFVAWASVFPLAEWLYAAYPALHVQSEVWNLPKYLVATGMILTLLEEQMGAAEQAALHDALTGLPNRRLFDRRLHQALAAADRSGTQVALLAIDLDRFKQVNDRFGHPVGDDVLNRLARRLQRRLRCSDTLARVGGDEFMVILPAMTDRSGAEQVAQALQSVLQEPVALGEAQVVVGGSIGITLYPQDARDPLALMTLADRRMYAHKAPAHADAIT